MAKLIAIDGLDACFKTTNINRLIKYLKEETNKKFITIKFPSYNSSSAYCIESYMKGKYPEIHYPEIFMVSNMVDYFNNIDYTGIQEAMSEEDTIILLDRYLLSTYLYRAARELKNGRSSLTDDYSKYVIFNSTMRYMDNLFSLLFEYNKKPIIPIHTDYNLFLYRNSQINSTLEEKENKDIIESDQLLNNCLYAISQYIISKFNKGYLMWGKYTTEHFIPICVEKEDLTNKSEDDLFKEILKSLEGIIND